MTLLERAYSIDTLYGYMEIIDNDDEMEVKSAICYQYRCMTQSISDKWDIDPELQSEREVKQLRSDRTKLRRLYEDIKAGKFGETESWWFE